MGDRGLAYMHISEGGVVCYRVWTSPNVCYLRVDVVGVTFSISLTLSVF